MHGGMIEKGIDIKYNLIWKIVCIFDGGYKSIMKNLNIKEFFKSLGIGKSIILIASIGIIIYLLYFISQIIFFYSKINGVDVSLKSHYDAETIIKNYAKDYKLQLIERNGEAEEIIGQSNK